MPHRALDRIRRGNFIAELLDKPHAGSLYTLAANGKDVLGTWGRARGTARSAELFFGQAGGEFHDDIQLT